MGKQFINRDWEIVRIFLILAVLTAGVVFGLHSFILTPVTIGHIPSYKSSLQTPLNRAPDKDVSRSGAFGSLSDGESLFLLKGQPHPSAQPYGSIDREISSEEADSHNRQVPLELKPSPQQ